MSHFFTRCVILIQMGTLLQGCADPKEIARKEYLQVLLEYGLENELFVSIEVEKSDSVRKAFVEIYDLWKGLKSKGDTGMFLPILSGDHPVEVEFIFEEDITWVENCQEVKRTFFEKGNEAVGVYFYDDRVQKKGLIQSRGELGCLIDELYNRNYIIYREDESGLLGIISVRDFKDHLDSIPLK